MASGTCRYSFECAPFGYSKCPSRSAPVSRSTRTTSSEVGIRCIALSMRSCAGKNFGKRQQQNLPVEDQRPVVDILHVQFHPCFEVYAVPARERPQACEP